MVTPSTGYRVVGLAAALVLLALLASQLATLLLGIVVAIILALPLAAVADLAERRALPRSLGAAVALALLLAALLGLLVLLVPQFVAQMRDFGQRIPALLASVEHRFGLHGARVGNLSGQLQSQVRSYTEHPQQLLGPLSQAGNAIALGIAGLVVTAVVAFSLAVRPAAALRFVYRLFPLERRPALGAVFARIRAAWIGWMTAVGLDMVVLGGLLWLGMALVGLPFAIGFAAFSALMTVIPNYGSIISAVPPMLAGLAVSPTVALEVLAVYVVVNQIEGNLLLPLIMSRTVDMHPAVVAIGLLVMAALFGLIGVFIAIPLISLVFILVQALWIEPLEGTAAPVLPPGASAAVPATDE